MKGLLEAGLDIDRKDNNGRTALHWAAQKNYEEVVDLLLEHNANREIRDNEGKLPLDLATNPAMKEKLIVKMKDSSPIEQMARVMKENGGSRVPRGLAQKGRK